MNQIKETHDLALATWKCKNAVMYPKIGDAKTIREIHSFGHISSLPILQNSPWLCQKCPPLFTFQIQTDAPPAGHISQKCSDLIFSESRV